MPRLVGRGQQGSTVINENLTTSGNAHAAHFHGSRNCLLLELFEYLIYFLKEQAF